MSKNFDAKSGKEIAQAIEDRIILVANEAFMNAPYNKTKYGKVISSNEGIFTIEIDRVQYPNILALRDVGEIKTNEVVIVCVPNNNMSNAYIVGVADGTLQQSGGSGTYVPVTRTINGLPLSSDIVLSAGNILTVSQLESVNSGITEGLTTQITTNQTSITTINAKIPNQASSSNQLADKNFVNSSINNIAAYIPTSINGLSGGTLTSPLVITGGDATTASKIVLSQSGSGQITDSFTSTLFGFMSSTKLTIGSTSYSTNIRGSGTRPTYNSNNLALYSDVPQISLSGNVLTITLP